MKNCIRFLILIFLISCNAKTGNINQVKSDSILSNKEQSSIKDSNIAKSDKTSDDSSDCAFDQKSQTDEFLKNIEELKNYKWNYDKRTATIILNDGDTLLIRRGGCQHFGVSAEFRLIHDKTDYSKLENVL